MSCIDEIMPCLKADNTLTDTKYRIESIIELMNLPPGEVADVHKIKCRTQADTEPYLHRFCSSLQLLQNLHRKEAMEKKTNHPIN